MNSIQSIVDNVFLPHIKKLCEQFFDEGIEMTLDGESCFAKNNYCVHGSAINGCCRVLTSLDKNSQEYKQWFDNVRKWLIETSYQSFTEFGIYEYLLALYQLKQHNIYDEIIDAELEERLKKILHWKDFINEHDFKFKRERANNYYGVAFRIAFLREELGWDKETFNTETLEFKDNVKEKYIKKNMLAREIFMERVFEHVVVEDGEIFYMDETDEAGRYDKYSHTIVSELCELYKLFDKPLPKRLKKMLHRATKVQVLLADTQGTGFTYGRSIGANATGAILEILPFAMSEDTPYDSKFLYSIIMTAVKSMETFWISPKRKMVNLWDDGKMTDNYRGKHRILEVNFDMPNKVFRACDYLKKIGWNLEEPLSEDLYKKELAKLPKFKYITYEKKSRNRGFIIYRNNDLVISLPLINGGKHWYNNMAYLPIPYGRDFIIGRANNRNVVSVPILKDSKGKEYAPICLFEDLKIESKGDIHIVKYRQSKICCIDGEAPEFIEGVTDDITYTFGPGFISREDNFTINDCNTNANNKKLIDIKKDKIEWKQLIMEINTFSKNLEENESELIFKKGKIYKIKYEGLNLEETDDVSQNKDYNTPLAPFNTKILLNRGINKNINIKVTYYYN